MQLKIPIVMPLPTQVSKKELRQHLGYPLAPISSKTLQRRLVKSGILKTANVTWEQLKFEQYFPPDVTAIIYQVWKIESLKA